jgi:PAS domain S-box-containing protein
LKRLLKISPSRADLKGDTMSDTKKNTGAEAASGDSEHEYRQIFDSVNDGIIIHDPQGEILDVNKNMYRRLGYTKAEMIEMNLQDIVSPEYARKIEPRTEILQEEGVAIFESGDIRKDGTVMPVEISAREIVFRNRKAILSVVRDITRRKMAEELISKSLSEKEILLREIQDQNKRTMQFFSLMLECHCSDSDSHDRDALPKMKQRIKAYKQIYEKFYRYENFTKIDFADFLDWQTKLLFSQFSPALTQVQYKRDIQNVYLDIHHAIPSGMIIQELVSNSLNHAFPDGRSGKIGVQMLTQNPGKYTLIIKDNGRGFPSTFDFQAANSLGFLLVKDFSRQIQGTIELSNNNGAQFTISFPSQ